MSGQPYKVFLLFFLEIKNSLFCGLNLKNREVFGLIFLKYDFVCQTFLPIVQIAAKIAALPCPSFGWDPPLS